ncbi:MAG: serine/threonine protein kinase, partial [Phycisphaerales bacterium]|nr:serine/threonine protein kinase [Phycisphaerales bacterium]
MGAVLVDPGLAPTRRPCRLVYTSRPMESDTPLVEPHTPARSDASVPGPGSVLAERYRLIERVGHGGMGTIWRGEHLALGTPVAIKLINPALVDDPDARDRFVREARAAATIRSPHVVQIFDYGVDDGTPYIAMELLEGESLAERLQRAGALAPEVTLRILTHVLRAITKAHEEGVVHRDLKPANVFLVEDDGAEIAKVLDFGVAKGLDGARLGTTTNTGMVLGTPHYMSPEQMMRSGTVDTQVDLWAVAIIAYECLLGRRPFEAQTLGELTVAVLVEAAPVPSQQGDVPAGFDAWFARATDRDPTRRFADATLMLEALEAALRGDGSALTLA